jgi:REP element-mobilizing transposase RayT
VHVTLRARAGVASLRAPNVYPLVERAIAATARPDGRVVHFSVQGEHLHLLVEATDERALSSLVRRVTIRTARAVNRILARRGPLWDGRYHRHDLKTPRETRNALVYVLGNWRKHRDRTAGLDPCSSARWFDGWRPPVGPAVAEPRVHAARPPVCRARTWLLAVEWRRGGLLGADEAPRASRARTPASAPAERARASASRPRACRAGS